MSIEKNIEELTSNVKGINKVLQDMRSLLSNHEVQKVFMESQCDHIRGFILSTNPGTNQIGYLVRVSDNKDNFQINKLFYFCPNCGTKLR